MACNSVSVSLHDYRGHVKTVARIQVASYQLNSKNNGPVFSILRLYLGTENLIGVVCYYG